MKVQDLKEKQIKEEIKKIELALYMLRDKTESGFNKVSVCDHFKQYKVKHHLWAASVCVDLGILTRKGSVNSGLYKWKGRAVNKIVSREICVILKEKYEASCKIKSEKDKQKRVNKIVKSKEKIDIQEFKNRLEFVVKETGCFKDELKELNKRIDLINKKEECKNDERTIVTTVKQTNKKTSNEKQNRTEVKILWGLLSYSKK